MARLDYFLEFKTLNCATGEPGIVQVRVVVIVDPFDPWGSVPGKNSFYRGPGGKWAQETCARCPKHWYATGELRQSPGTGQCGDCIMVLWVPCLWDRYSGKLRFIGKPGVQDEEDRHVAKRSSDPRVANPEVTVQVRDLVRAVGIVAPFALRGSVRSKKSFYRAPEGKWAQETCGGAPTIGTPRESLVKFGSVPCRDCRRILWVLDPWDQNSGNIFLSRNPGYKKMG